MIFRGIPFKGGEGRIMFVYNKVSAYNRGSRPIIRCDYMCLSQIDEHYSVPCPLKAPFSLSLPLLLCLRVLRHGSVGLRDLGVVHGGEREKETHTQHAGAGG